jgi:hypothetical protein
MLLQKSMRTSRGAIVPNNRISPSEFLNQRCAMVPDLESMLLAWMRKIFLRQYLPEADIRIE